MKQIKHGQYFETHFTVPSDYAIPVISDFKLYESRNILKPDMKMLTFRTYSGTAVDHQINVIEILLNIPVLKQITEFAIYDSNPKHDSYWMS